MPLHEKIYEEIDTYGKERSEGSVAVYMGEKSEAIIDFANPKGGNIVFGGDFLKTHLFGQDPIDETTVLKTNLYYHLNTQEDNEDIDLTLKTIYNFNTYGVMEFGKDTLVLIADAGVRNIAQRYMKYQDLDSILLLSKGKQKYILPTPDEMIGLIGDKNISEMSKAKTKATEKNDLKVYETPSDILKTVVRAFDYNGFASLVQKEIATRLYVLLSASEKQKESFKQLTNIQTDTDKHMFIRYATAYITHKIMLSYGHPVKNRMFDDEDATGELTPASQKDYERFHEMIFDDDNVLGGKKAQEIFQYIEAIIKQAKTLNNPLATILADKETYSKTMGKELKAENLVLFDPQAGSAEALMSAVDAVGMGEHFKLWGTEFRENIDYGKNKERVNIINGVNTATMSTIFANTFFQKNYHTAVQSMITWNNPPYSLDDGIAKTSLDMYKNNTLITGLYPVKMEKYLQNTMQQGGLIIDVPAKLTGYTDPSTPSRFLLVFGKKFTSEAEARENDVEISGVFAHATSVATTKLTLDENATQEDLLRMINAYFASTGTLGTKVMKNLDYFHKRNWKEENVLYKTLSTGINELKNFYENAEKFDAVVKSDKTKTLFSEATQPLQLARTEKVFLDTRFYSAKGEYTALRFTEVVSNVPLLIHYAKTKPKIFDIVKQIAKEKGVTLPVDTDAIHTEHFKIGEPYTGKKTKVATKKLGMMKFNFYPTDIDVQNEKSRNNLLKVIASIYSDNGRELTDSETETLKETMKLSTVLTTKTETVSTIDTELDEYMVQSQECLVLEGDNHSVKLNVSNFDFYNKLEELGYFSIDDYIELVELQVDTKTKIIKGFNDYIENVTLRDMAEKTGIDVSLFAKNVDTKIATLKEKGKNTKDIIKELNEEFKIRPYVESFFEKTKSMNLKKNIHPVIDKYFGKEFKTETKEGRKKLTEFIDNVEKVYLTSKEQFFEENLDIIMSNMLTSVKKKYEHEDTFTPDMKIELDVKFSNMMEEIGITLGDLEKFIKETASMTSRLGMTLYYTYPKLKKVEETANAFKQAGKTKEETILYDKAYDTIFSSWERKVTGLMEHQIQEPENFVEHKEARTNFMLKKMRTGKTLTFIFTGFLEMLINKSDMEMYVKSTTLKDIGSQLTQHIPMLLPSIRAYANSTHTQFVDDISFDTMYHTSAVSNPFKIKGFANQLVGGGAMQEKLANNFSKEIKMIEIALQEKYPNGVTLDDLLKDYKDSPFIDMIEKAKEQCG